MPRQTMDLACKMYQTKKCFLAKNQEDDKECTLITVRSYTIILCLNNILFLPIQEFLNGRITFLWFAIQSITLHVLKNRVYIIYFSLEVLKQTTFVEMHFINTSRTNLDDIHKDLITNPYFESCVIFSVKPKCKILKILRNKNLPLGWSSNINKEKIQYISLFYVRLGKLYRLNAKEFYKIKLLS